MSEIAGYVKMTAGEIRVFTNRADRFRALHDKYKALADAKLAAEEAAKSWLSRLFLSHNVWHWHDVYRKTVPSYLRGDVLQEWEERVRGMDDSTVILIDVDDARLLRWIAESLDKEVSS